MSRSRLHNHRNAHSGEDSEKPFFSKQQKGNDAPGKGTFFQAKLSVNEPGDKFEREADAVADKVVANKTASDQPTVQRLSTEDESKMPSTNDGRLAEDKLIQEKPEIQKHTAPEQEEEQPGIQKKDNPLKEEEEKGAATDVQTKKAGAATAPAQVDSSLQSSAGHGKSLSPKVRDEMSSSFGVDFNKVKIHEDAEAVQLNESLNAQAFTHGSDIYFNSGRFNPENSEGKHLLAHELTHVVQQGHGEKANSIQKNGDKDKKSLIDQFAGKFPDSIDAIKNSAEALLLVKEASDAGVEFGGYSEEGPAKNAWPYTIDKSVYVPKAHKAKKIQAAGDFLFELNNAIRSSSFKTLETEAGKGSKGTLSAKTYAKQVVEHEVDGMLRLGKVWVDMKMKKPKGEKWSQYDGDFYLSEYNDVKSGKKTKDDIVKDALSRTYPEGDNKGKTVEQFYMEQYNQISGGK